MAPGKFHQPHFWKQRSFCLAW